MRASFVALTGVVHAGNCSSAERGAFTEVDVEVGAVNVDLHRVVMIDDPDWPGIALHGCKRLSRP